MSQKTPYFLVRMRVVVMRPATCRGCHDRASHRRAVLATLSVVAIALAQHAFAQPTAPTTPTSQSQPRPTSSGDPVPDADYAPTPPPPPQEVGKPAMRPATAYAMPDLPDSWSEATTFDGRAFSTRLNIVPLVDYTAFSQDDDSVAQVGEQDSQWDLRTFRIMTGGRLKFRHPVQYFISVEVKGRDHVTSDEDSKLGFTDWYLGTSLGRLGEIRVGKIKEPFIYEVVGDAANLQQQERILSPAFVSTRGIGLRLSNTMAGDRMTWAAGWFNDWWIEDEAFDESGNQFTGRLTGLPYWAGDGAHYLHVGVSVRYSGANQGTMRFRARPESNTASYYLDTGALTADHANEMNLETVWGHGPFFVTSDWSQAWVDASASGDPYFWGAYVAVSYVLTGEHRNYDRSVAYARRVLPTGRRGAWEVMARYSRVDLDDRLVQGGTLDKSTIGLTWWATRRWRIGFDYGLTKLDRFGVHGLTHAVHTRFQWTY